jgi:Domain of unknown function (DUF3597)
MKVYESIRDKIFDPESLAISSVPPTSGSTPQIDGGSATPIVASLSSPAANQTEDFHWQSSILDLMKLLGLDSSIANRRLLAQELAYFGDLTDTVAVDCWLHRCCDEQFGRQFQARWALVTAQNVAAGQRQSCRPTKSTGGRQTRYSGRSVR